MGRNVLFSDGSLGGGECILGKLSRLIPECGYVGLLFFTHFITSSSSRQPLDSDYVTLVNVAYGYEMAKEHWRSHLLCTIWTHHIDQI